MERTYWKARVTVAVREPESGLYLHEMVIGHRARRSTLASALEAVAVEAYKAFRGRRIEDMRDDAYRYLPYWNSENKEAMVEDPNATPTEKATRDFLLDRERSNADLEKEVISLGKDLKRCYSTIDGLLELLSQPPMYKRLREPLYK